MRGNVHVRFGGRGQEDLQPKGCKASCPDPTCPLRPGNRLVFVSSISSRYQQPSTMVYSQVETLPLLQSSAQGSLTRFLSGSLMVEGCACNRSGDTGSARRL